MKVGVLVVAYNAETTLVDVLDRIPHCRVAAARRGAGAATTTPPTTPTASASEYLQREQPTCQLTVVRHPQNLGYGGNQKAGYTYADQPRLGRRGAAPRRRPVRAGDHGRHHRPDRATATPTPCSGRG